MATMTSRFPLAVQSLFCTLSGASPDSREIEAWLERVERIAEAGGSAFRGVQLHTLARKPAEESCGPVERSFLEGLAESLEKRAITSEVF